jgi:hypothetical protein
MIVYLSSVTICVILRVIIVNSPFALFTMVIDLIQYFVVPFFFDIKLNKKNILRVCIAFLLNLGFQLVAVLTKSIGIQLTTDNSITAIIFMIDLYIMLALYYLYANNLRKEKN